MRVPTVVHRILLLLVATMAMLPLAAQDIPPATTGDPLASPNHLGRGASLPFYFLLQHFFHEGAELHAMGEDWLEFNMLRQLGIEPGSKAEEILVAAVVEGSDALRGVLPLDPDEASEESDTRRRVFLSGKIHRAAQIYSWMITELTQTGVDRVRVEDFIRFDLGQGVSVLSGSGRSTESLEFLEFVRREFALATASASLGQETQE